MTCINMIHLVFIMLNNIANKLFNFSKKGKLLISINSVQFPENTYVYLYCYILGIVGDLTHLRVDLTC